MPKRDAPDVTQLLLEWRKGDDVSFERLAAVVYRELHGIAAQHLRHEAPNRTLQTTGLVHEAFLRLVDQTRVQWQDRLHFFRVAAQMMRRILIDEARSRNAKKRGGDVKKISLEALAEPSLERPEELIALDDALDGLQEFDTELAQVVELRYFAGFGLDEIAKLLEVSPSTVSRRWRIARAWLYRYLANDPATSPPD